MNRFHTLLHIYESFHDRRANRVLHWLGTPPILASLLVALRALPVPAEWRLAHLDVATLAIAGVVLICARLSWRVAIGLGLALLALYFLSLPLDALPAAWLWPSVVVLFFGGWALQFWGHAVQGQSPRFVAQPIFLLIGPAALICQLYDRLHLRY